MGVTAGGYGAAPICPIFCNGGWCWPMTHVTMPGLTILGDKGQVEPSLATSWEANETADVWTFTLDPNAKWSDGEPLTANDVSFTYHLGLNPATNSNWAQQAPGIESPQSKAQPLFAMAPRIRSKASKSWMIRPLSSQWKNRTVSSTG